MVNVYIYKQEHCYWMLSFLVQRATVDFKIEHIWTWIYSKKRENQFKIAGLQKQPF